MIGTSTKATCGIVSAALLGTILCATPALAREGDEGSLARGGKLYDKWYKVVGVDAPTESHPAYPAGKKYADKPKSNWRCKECHGWDYMGKDGAYSSGKHSTGIVGINGMAGAEPAKIVALLKSDTHGYAGKMEDEDFMDLAYFVSKGQVDMNEYIDRATKMPKGGNAEQGEAYFNTICVGCHDIDGKKPKDMDKSLGAQMGNPWEVMHKILNGQPAEKMPALRALPRQVTLDIMAHLKTLPKE